ERRRWMTQLRMLRLLGETHIDFYRYRYVAIAASAVFMVIGFAAAVVRGRQLLDIDFVGGSSVQIVLNEPIAVDQVRERVSGMADSVSVTEITSTAYPDDTVYRVDTSIQEDEELRQE